MLFRSDVIKKLIGDEDSIKEEEDKKEETDEDDKMSIQMSNKLSELKKEMKKKGETLDEVFGDIVKEIQDEENNKYCIMEKNKFFEKMENYGVKMNDKIKEAIYELFKSEYNQGEDKNENEVQFIDYNKLKQIL